jgi:sec-independent protein translocase protein TatA
MGAFSIWHILILGAAALLLFGGRGKISDLMGDVGKGIKSFRIGLTEPDHPPQTVPADVPVAQSRLGESQSANSASPVVER